VTQGITRAVLDDTGSESHTVVRLAHVSRGATGNYVRRGPRGRLWSAWYLRTEPYKQRWRLEKSSWGERTPMKPRKLVTPAELLERLANDPEFQAAEAERVREHDARVAHSRMLIAPVLHDLRDVGCVGDDWDTLLKGSVPFQKPAVDILLSWLERSTDPTLQETLVRGLAATGVPFDGGVLTRLFDSTDSHPLRWAIGNTIESARVTGVAAWVEQTVVNPRFGTARQMLVLAIPRLLPVDRAQALLLDMLEAFPGHAAKALAKIGDEGAVPRLRAALPGKSGWVSNAIEAAIRRIGPPPDDFAKSTTSTY
jgi:hypothetical protein